MHNKSKILFLCCLLMLCVSMHSQRRLDKPQFYVGTSHGATVSMVGFNPSVEQSQLLGYNGGFLCRYIADEYVGVQLELMCSQQGWHETDGFYRRLNYITLPFLTHIYLGNKARFIVNLGPQIGLLLSESHDENSVDTSKHQHITDAQGKFDYGFTLGIGFSFNAGKNTFELEPRFYYAMSDVYSNKATDYFARSNNLTLSVNLKWLLQVR